MAVLVAAAALAVHTPNAGGATDAVDDDLSGVRDEVVWTASPERIIVTIDTTTATDEIERLASALDRLDRFQVVDVLESALDALVLELKEGIGREAAELVPALLRGLPQIAEVEREQVFTLQVDPARSPMGVDQSSPPWGLDRIDQRDLPLDGRFRAPSAGSATRIYVVDSGIRAGHREFGARIASGQDFVADGLGTGDCNGHGTHVAGTIAAQTWGVAKDATVVPVRVFGCSMSTSTSTVLAGLDWIAATHPPGTPGVVNLSFGGNPSPAVDQAVSSLVARGLTVVAAAGNAGGDACAMTPGRNPAVITVGATTTTDARLFSSNWGPCVDLFAPGDAITSAGISSVSATSVQTGTSMASPHVAGAAALLIAQGAHDPAAVRCHLTEQATVGRLTDLVGSPDRLLYVGPPSTSSSTSPCGELTPDMSDPLPRPERLAGADRFATAAALSARRFEPDVPVVYLASGASFADALAAGPVAGGRGPVLLVRRESIPAATVAELTRLSPGRIVVLGGDAAVGGEVLSAARSFTSGSVMRVGGSDRFATAAVLSAAAVEPGVETVFVATGVSFADALSVGPAAAGVGPVLLTRPDRVPAATVEELVRLRPGRIVVLGGPGAVSDAVLRELRGYTGGSVVRWAGVDRFATSVAISQARFSPGVDVVFVATGSSFADALAAGPVAAGLGPVLLARAECVPRVVLDEIERLRPAEIVVVSGSGALGASVMALTPCG